MKETNLNNELCTKFLNIALDITPKSIFYTQCRFCQVDDTDLAEILPNVLVLRVFTSAYRLWI